MSAEREIQRLWRQTSGFQEDGVINTRFLTASVSSPLSATNPRMCAPPGILVPGTGPMVVVASRPRSGTHLLIDLLLNHFAELCGTPLYVDLDRFLEQGCLESFAAGQFAGYVVKTHYPFLVANIDCLEGPVCRLLEHPDAKILVVERDTDQVMASMEDMFGTVPSFEQFNLLDQKFDKTWRGPASLVVKFDELLDPGSMPRLLNDISQHIFARPYRGELVYPVPKSRRFTALLHKALTRLLGMRAPRISTGIKLSKIKPDGTP